MKITIIDRSSESSKDFYLASIASISQILSLFSYWCLFTKFMMSCLFRASKSPSDPITIKVPSKFKYFVDISGSLMTPNRLKALIPKERETGMPTLVKLLPGIHIFKGPAFCPLKNSSFSTIPPHFYTLSFSSGFSNL